MNAACQISSVSKAFLPMTLRATLRTVSGDPPCPTPVMPASVSTSTTMLLCGNACAPLRSQLGGKKTRIFVTFVGDSLLIKRIMGHALTLPEPVWTRLNIAWIAFFLFCGAANLFVAFTFQSYWVDFKVFGSLGMTLLFLIGQGIYLSRHLHDADTTTPKTED